jgi:hypothetical protein
VIAGENFLEVGHSESITAYIMQQTISRGHQVDNENFK